MLNVIETAKSATIAYNDKNWDKVKSVFDEKGVYDEKATGRRIQVFRVEGGKVKSFTHYLLLFSRNVTPLTVQ